MKNQLFYIFLIFILSISSNNETLAQLPNVTKRDMLQPRLQLVDSNKDKIDKWTTEIMPKAIKEHRSLVSIPCDAFSDDMQKNVDWLKKAFTKRRFAVKELATSTVPIVFAERIVDSRLPTVLFYFHFDGQPVDKRKWDQEDPFTPVIKQKNPEGKWETISYDKINDWDKEWRVFARAAADDKAPIIMFLQALDIMKEQSVSQAFNIKVLLDGEEEKSSTGLKETIDKYKDNYAADHIIIMDGPAHPTNRPTLMFGCRGIASATLIVYGPKVPQHSGHYGNYAPNPAFRASNLLASMKSDDGRVKIKGFYDGIVFDAKTKKILADVPDDEMYIRTQIGIAQPDNVGNSYQEALQYPSLNIKGMSCAWIGKQTRTIVPDKAIVQLGIRLVKETDGVDMINLIQKHIENEGYYVIDREPTEEERLKYPKIATYIGRPSVNAFRTELDSPTGEWLTRAIQNVYSTEEDVIRIRTMGGTIPVTPIIQAINAPAVIVPMVNMDNNQHSPNENIRIGNLYNGIKTCFGILTEGI
jgi:acetylornithine deacetylase/succinyl-diaminopimelate desuccinylase-like protein